MVIFIPIYGGNGKTTDDAKKKTLNLTAGEWNRFDIPLTDAAFLGLNWSSIFQMKFVESSGIDAFCVDNVYFWKYPERGTQLTQDGHTIYLDCVKSGNTYTMTISSDENLNGLGGSFVTINENSNTDLRNLIQTSNINSIVISFESTSTPNFYTPLYVMMSGEVNFGYINDIIEWKNN